MKIIRHLGVLFFCLLSYGQAPVVDFDAASIRPAVGLTKSQLFAAMSAGQSSFVDVAPETLRMAHVTLKGAIAWAYQMNKNYQISGGPSWIDSDVYDIIAKTAEPVSESELRAAFQRLLADRFQLTVHRDRKDVPARVIVVAKDGLKLKPASAAGRATIMPIRSGSGLPALEAKGVLMSEFASFLTTFLASGPLDIVPVIDMTGLIGRFDFNLAPRDEDVAGAIEEQLGLELESRRVPVEILVVDQAERASEN